MTAAASCEPVGCTQVRASDANAPVLPHSSGWAPDRSAPEPIAVVCRSKAPVPPVTNPRLTAAGSQLPQAGSDQKNVLASVRSVPLVVTMRSTASVRWVRHAVFTTWLLVASSQRPPDS